MNWPPFRRDTWAYPWRLRDSPKHVLMSDYEIITDGDRAVSFPDDTAIRAVACSGRHCDDMTITICPFTRR